jgi:hypothetical protein
MIKDRHCAAMPVFFCFGVKKVALLRLGAAVKGH